MADAGRRAALANAQNAKLNSSALPDVERRLQACSLVTTPASESRRRELQALLHPLPSPCPCYAAGGLRGGGHL
eukprot:scaffold51499_cov34-Phaeocystis_antarctica.AAC.2